MSTAEASAAPASELDLTSPQEPDTFTGTFTPFMQEAIPTNFSLHLPTSKTPRNPSRIRPFQGGEDDSAGVSFDSSPGRRGRHFHLQHGGGESSITAATPRSSMAFASGISQSADPTPIRFNQQSSPGSARNVLRGVIVPGDDIDYNTWDLTPARDFNEGGLMDNDRTPMQSPTTARAGSKRTLSGLGSSPMRTAKRSRYATMGPTSNPPSVPPSPLRQRTTSSSGDLMTTMPLERSASTSLAPPSSYSSQSRIVSHASMISSVSTELISPALSPTYGSFSPFPTSMSAPDMMGSLSSYSNHSTPHMAPAQPPTIAPRDIMGNNSSYQPMPPTSIYASPDMVDGDIPTLSHPVQMPMPQSANSSPSISSSTTSHIPTFPSHDAQRSMTLGTIHEQEGQVALVTPETPQGPTFTYEEGYSVGMAPSEVMVDTTAEYPAPPQSYITYQAPSPRQQVGSGQDWQPQQYQQPHPTAQLNYQVRPPPINEHGTTSYFWNTGAAGSSNEQYHGHPHPRQMPHQQEHHPHHMPMSRAASVSYSHDQPYIYQQPNYGPSGTHPHHPPTQPYAPSGHHHPPPHFGRSASTGTMSTIPSMSQIPTGGSTQGLFYMPEPGPSSAPMTHTTSLPVQPHPALQQEHTISPTDMIWNTESGHSMIPPAMYHFESGSGSGSLQQSIPSSPATPSRKRHPPVGKRLRPGPKPRGTPKKGRQASGSSNMPSSSGVEDEGSTSEIPSSQITSPEISHAAGPSRSAPALELGGPLPMAFAPAPPPLQAGPARASSSQPRRGSAQAVKLQLAPPARSHTPEGLQLAGLPKDFIDKLYTTYVTMEGSTTGQPSKRFRCLIEGCERTFPRKSAISSHIQTHLDDKPFVCGEHDCKASFVRQHDLRRHMRIHTGTKPFPCPCGKGFARGDALMRHRQRNICTGGVPPEPAEQVQ